MTSKFLKLRQDHYDYMFDTKCENKEKDKDGDPDTKENDKSCIDMVKYQCVFGKYMNTCSYHNLSTVLNFFYTTINGYLQSSAPALKLTEIKTYFKTSNETYGKLHKNIHGYAMSGLSYESKIFSKEFKSITDDDTRTAIEKQYNKDLIGFDLLMKALDIDILYNKYYSDIYDKVDIKYLDKLLIPSGYITQKGGHAVVIFCAKKDTKHTALLFNNGEGMKQYHGDKIGNKYRGILEFNDLNETQIKKIVAGSIILTSGIYSNINDFYKFIKHVVTDATYAQATNIQYARNDIRLTPCQLHESGTYESFYYYMKYMLQADLQFDVFYNTVFLDKVRTSFDTYLKSQKIITDCHINYIFFDYTISPSNYETIKKWADASNNKWYSNDNLTGYTTSFDNTSGETLNNLFEDKPKECKTIIDYLNKIYYLLERYFGEFKFGDKCSITPGASSVFGINLVYSHAISLLVNLVNNSDSMLPEGIKPMWGDINNKPILDTINLILKINDTLRKFEEKYHINNVSINDINSKLGVQQSFIDGVNMLNYIIDSGHKIKILCCLLACLLNKKHAFFPIPEQRVITNSEKNLINQIFDNNIYTPSSFPKIPYDKSVALFEQYYDLIFLKSYIKTNKEIPFFEFKVKSLVANAFELEATTKILTIFSSVFNNTDNIRKNPKTTSEMFKNLYADFTGYHTEFKSLLTTVGPAGNSSIKDYKYEGIMTPHKLVLPERLKHSIKSPETVAPSIDNLSPMKHYSGDITLYTIVEAINDKNFDYINNTQIKLCYINHYTYDIFNVDPKRTKFDGNMSKYSMMRLTSAQYIVKNTFVGKIFDPKNNTVSAYDNIMTYNDGKSVADTIKIDNILTHYIKDSVFFYILYVMAFFNIDISAHKKKTG